MTDFETYSLLISVCQLGLIAWGILSMRGSNTSRDAQLKVLEDIGTRIREQSAGIRALLERGV